MNKFPCIVVLILSLLLTCAPVAVQQEKFTFDDLQEYAQLKPDAIRSEIIRLVRMREDSVFKIEESDTLQDSSITNENRRLERSDSVSAEDTLMTENSLVARLFALETHRLNSSPNYQKALEYTRYLFEKKVDNWLYYVNWGWMLKKHLDLMGERDSLMVVIENTGSDVLDIEKRENGLRWKIRQQQQSIDSLNGLLSVQEERIKKLEKLDMRMEMQRGITP